MRTSLCGSPVPILLQKSEMSEASAASASKRGFGFHSLRWSGASKHLH
jgi:hypothetical protein